MENIITTKNPLLDAVWASPMECEGQYQLFTIKNKNVKARPIKHDEDVSQIVRNLSDKEFDVYFAMARFKDGSSRKVDNAIGARSFWLDIDCGASKAHEGKGYANQTEAIKALRIFFEILKLAPTYIVSSGNGLHVHFILDREVPKAEWLEIAAKLKTIVRQHGLLADESVTDDFVRVLRVPDTKNFKDPTNPKNVDLIFTRKILKAEVFVAKIEDAYSESKPLSSNTSVDQESYPFTTDNATNVLQAAQTAYPRGIKSRDEFSSLGMALAYLVVFENWPEKEARAILDEVSSKPIDADRSNNDSEWNNYLSGTKEKFKTGGAVTSHRSLIAKAIANGWKQKPKNSDAILAVQNKFALISLGGKIGIIDQEELAKNNIDGTAASLVVMNRNDGGLLIQRFIASEYPQVDSRNTFNNFLHNKHTIIYKGVEFNPKNTSENTLNLWVGMTISPSSGEWPYIKTLLRDVLCGGREAEYQYLLKFIAHAIQRPWEKPGVMVILLGGQGIGKGTLAKLLKKIWSATFLQANRIKQVVGDFNGSLERAYIVFLDEALFAGDRNSSDALKSLVTESTISINEKHQPARQITSYHRFFSATNAEHFKSTDRDDRRDFVLRVSEERKGDYGFWNAVNAEIEGDGVEAFVHDLMNLDLINFNVRAKPNTHELTEQKLQSLDRFPRWWFDCLFQGKVREGCEWPEFVSGHSLIGSFKQSDQNLRSYKQFIDRDLVSFMSKVCPSARREQRTENSARRRGYLLPPLEIARKDFEKYIGDSIEWEAI